MLLCFFDNMKAKKKNNVDLFKQQAFVAKTQFTSLGVSVDKKLKYYRRQTEYGFLLLCQTIVILLKSSG
jgi:hypothetical protein